MAIQKIQSQDRIISQLQDNIIPPIELLQGIPINSGQLLQDVVLTTGTNTINHKLQRDLIGWFLTRIRSSATVYDDQDNNDLPTRTLILVSSGNVTVDLYVF